jgi:NitT/TauT family transport system substrate-binding protein
MMSRKLHVPALVLVALLAVLAAGCGASGSSSTAGTPVLQKVGNLEKTTLNVSVLANLDSAGFFVALHEGLFAQEGLQVKYSPAFSDSIIAAQAKGQYDITGMNYVSYIEAVVRHVAALRIFAEGSLLQSGDDVIMVMPHSRIQSLKALKGHALGVNTTANIGLLLVDSLLSQEGIPMKATPGYSANSVMLPTDPNFPFPASQPLASGQVSAAIMSEPFATLLAEQYGASIIDDTNSGATSQFPMVGYAVTKAWAAANPNTLRAFNIALQAGQEIADTNRKAVEAAFVALPQGEGHVDSVTAALMALSTYPLGVTPTRLQRVADVMQQFGFLKQRFNIDQLLN